MAYDSATIVAVWNKGTPVLGQNSTVVRQDHLGNTIHFSEYGNRQSAWGWEIDHITPSIFGGADHIGNMRPLHWRANARQGGILGNL